MSHEKTARPPRVLIPLAPGFEELEALAPLDYLRRAGAHVVTASVGGKNPIKSRGNARLMADIDLDEALAEWGDDWDAVVLPGGPGVAVLAECAPLMALVGRRLAAAKLVGAICAAPALLPPAGLAKTTRVTSWPGKQEELSQLAVYVEAPVVVDGAVITSRGPGTSVAFALSLVAALFGQDAADALAAETQAG